MDMKTSAMIEVMKAYLDGKKIEMRPRTGESGDGGWRESEHDPLWDWKNWEYRVRPAMCPKGEGPVGGRIFYIDPESDEEVAFFDIERKEIPAIGLGDMPYYYKVTKRGNRPKYWIYHHRFSDRRMWEPDDIDGVMVGTSEEFGKGAENTEKVLSKYGICTGEDKGTIWDYVLKMRSEGFGECDDWFIPSKGELFRLREFFRSEAAEMHCLTDVFNIGYLWSSSEYSSSIAWFWYCNLQVFAGNKDNIYSVCGVRAL